MPLFSFGGPSYGLEDAKVATNNGNGTFGVNQDVPSVQMLQVAIQTTTANLEGDDRITATASKMISGQVTLRFGSVPFEVYAILTGSPLQSSGSGDSAYRFLDIASRKMPYWGIIGRADAAEGSGDTHIFVPKCKITEGFTIKLEYNTFSIPEVTCLAVGDENFPDANGNPTVMRVIEHPDLELATLPPTYI